ncbi:MAG: divalent-cation tolerance protein CutA [Deltaproteobacteria bacterium]|nr:divalent-cation tolerance protein CutA [Deltaproteobacteria bacterium]
MTDYYRVLINATTKDEAKKILRHLLEKHLVAGGMITEGESQYWWNHQVEEKIYYNLSAFTVAMHQKKIIDETRQIHKDETPVIAFFKIDDGNEDFLKWIEENTRFAPSSL